MLQECYSRPWLIASMVGGPIATAIYFSSGLAGIVVAALIGIAAAAAAWYTTRDAAAKECPPDWDCGTGVPIGAVAVALAGFAVACMWIDTVRMLNHVGLVLGGMHAASKALLVSLL